MSRKVPFIIGLSLALIISALTLPDAPTPNGGASAASPAPFKTVKRLVQGAFARLAPSSPQVSAPDGQVVLRDAVMAEQIRVPAVREGVHYGWIQLPRGTAVEFVADEGETLLVRYDGAVLRMPERNARDGSVTVRASKPPLLKI